MYESAAQVKVVFLFSSLPFSSLSYKISSLRSFPDSSDPCIHGLGRMSLFPGEVRNHFFKLLTLMG